MDECGHICIHLYLNFRARPTVFSSSILLPTLLPASCLLSLRKHCTVASKRFVALQRIENTALSLRKRFVALERLDSCLLKPSTTLYCRFESASWHLNASKTRYCRFEIASCQQNVSKTLYYRTCTPRKHCTIASKSLRVNV